jgi:acetyl-CoA acetyltransferase family protein
MCGSSQQAIHFAAQAILAGDMRIAIAGGIEMMSHHPIGSDWPEAWPADFPYELVHQGLSAEFMAEKWSLTRDELDDYAYQSHKRAASGHRKGMMAISVPATGVTLDRDEGVRTAPDREKMRALGPVFKEGGVITAGNSSQVSDGAAAVLLASEQALTDHNLTPLARIAERVVIGSDPVLMLDGPIPATRKALGRAGLELHELEAIEINEAFAAVVLAWQRELHTDLKIVNINGGAIAHGHPLGATGAVLMTKLVHSLNPGRYGLQTMCIGHGMATATIIERV